MLRRPKVKRKLQLKRWDMGGFLSFIADRYHRKSEDVASDVVTYLINEFPVQDAIGTLLKRLGFPDPPLKFRAYPRQSGEYGIPDIKLRDKDGNARVIIENKFWAPLTNLQPCGYLNEPGAWSWCCLSCLNPEYGEFGRTCVVAARATKCTDPSLGLSDILFTRWEGCARSM
jgi:hypothetical protein